MHQDAMVRMQENLLKQQQKQQELSDRIAQTRPNPRSVTTTAG